MNVQYDKSHRSQENAEHTRSDRELSEFIIEGVDRFLSRVFEGHPILLADFLDSSEEYFDNYIIDTSQNEQLSFAGGKLILTPTPVSDRRSAPTLFGFRQKTIRRSTSSIPIEVTANLYFQDTQKNWVKKTVQGHIASDSIRDWDTAPELKDLRNGSPIEFSIVPPKDNI